MDLIERMARSAGAYITATGMGDMCIGDMDDAEFRALMDAALAAIRETHAIVPREPTEAMINAGDSVLADPEIVRHDGSVHIVDGDVSVVYHAMIEAGEAII